MLMSSEALRNTLLVCIFGISVCLDSVRSEKTGNLNVELSAISPDHIALIECAVQVIKKYSVFRDVILVEPHDPVYVLDNPSHAENSTAYIFSHADVLLRLNHPVILMSEGNLASLHGFFVVFTYRVDEAFSNMFLDIHMTKNNRFLIVLLGEHKENAWELFELFFQFMKLHVINVVMLVIRMNAVYAFDCHPFDKNVTVADIWRKDTKQFEKEVDLYDEVSKVKNMHKFKIKCLTKNKPPDSVVYRKNNTWIFDGLGVNLLLEVSRKLNFTPDILFPEPDSPQNVDRFGYDISPNMNNLIIGALTIREVDLAYGVFSHLLYGSATTEFSMSAAEECFTFAVPAYAGRPPSIWSDFTNAFKPIVWLLLGFTFIFNVMVWYFASVWHNHKFLILMSIPEEFNEVTIDRRIQVRAAQRCKTNLEYVVNDSLVNFKTNVLRSEIKSTHHNPLSYLGDFLNYLRSKIPLSRRRSPNRHMIQNETLIFKNNNLEKRKKLLSKARTIMSGQRRADTDQAIVPAKVSLIQVIFLEIALTLGIPSLNKVGGTWILKFLFMQYVFFCLITSQAYLGSLGSFMTYPNEKGQIETPDELYERNLKLVGVPQSKRILERAFSRKQILKKLSERYVIYTGYYDNLLLDIHEERNISTFATSRFLQFYINNNPVLKNNPNSIFLFPKCTVNSYSSPFLFQRGSPLIDPFNKILYRIIEAGITKKWYESSTPRKMIVTRDPVQRLDMAQIMACFVVLLILHAMSLVVFITELIVHFYEVNKATNQI